MKKPKVASDDTELYVSGKVITVAQIKARKFFGTPNEQLLETELKIMQQLAYERVKAKGYRKESQLSFVAGDVLFEFAFSQRKNPEMTKFLNTSSRKIQRFIMEYVQDERNREGATVLFNV